MIVITQPNLQYLILDTGEWWGEKDDYFKNPWRPGYRGDDRIFQQTKCAKINLPFPHIII